MDDKPTLDELITHVDVGVEWMRLGVLLKLNMKDLQAIDHMKPAISDKLQQMYNKWLTSKTGATRRQLLDALRVLNLNVLAEEYKEWVRVTFNKPPITRHMASSKVKSKPAPQSLDITDLNEILTLLRSGLFNGSWEDLGLQLGLYKPTLSNIQANYPRDNDACLRECIAKWLQKADAVDSKGGASYVTLAEALEKMGQKNPANYIRSEKLGLQKNTHSSGLRERQPQPEPVSTASVGSSYIAEEEDGYLSHSDNEYPSTNAREQSSSETAARRRKGKDRTIQESLQPRPPPKQNKDGYDLPLGIAQDNDYKAGGATLQPKEETDSEPPAANRRLCLKDFALVIICLVMLILLMAFCYLLDCPQSKSNTTESLPVGIFGLFFIILLVAGYYLKGFAFVVYCFYIVNKFLQRFRS